MFTKCGKIIPLSRLISIFNCVVVVIFVYHRYNSENPYIEHQTRSHGQFSKIQPLGRPLIRCDEEVSGRE